MREGVVGEVRGKVHSGDIFYSVRQGGRWIVKTCFTPMSVLVVFAHMHNCKVAYRDPKPKNLVLNNEDEGIVKIVEFGLAKVITNDQTYTYCVTKDYAIDYWGLGVGGVDLRAN